ncbi:MAG: hypothetical protein QM667_13430 [Asticcacaulis sp.]
MKEIPFFKSARPVLKVVENAAHEHAEHILPTAKATAHKAVRTTRRYLARHPGLGLATALAAGLAGGAAAAVWLERQSHAGRRVDWRWR